MSFGNPLFLLGALLATVPVLIHLTGRKRARTVEFPSLRFLVEIEKALAVRYKLRQLVLLFMRTASICLLSLGLALPRLEKDTGVIPGGRQTSTIFVVDNSLSMNARSGTTTLLERSKQVLLKWLQALGAQQRAAVLPLHGEKGKKPSLISDHKKLAEETKRIEATCLGTDLGQALQVALKTLEKDTAPLKQIVVLSDFAKSTPPPEITLPADTRLIAMKTAATGRNPALSGMSVASDTPERISVRCQVINSGTGQARGKLVLKAGNEEAGTRRLLVPQGSTAEEFFSLKEPHSNLLRAKIISREDLISQDNQRNLVLRRSRKLQVLLVRDRQSEVPQLGETFWLSRALSAQAGGIKLSSVKAAGIPGENLNHYVAVFVLGVRRLGEASIKALNDYVREGGALFFVAGEAMDITWYRSLTAPPNPLFPALPSGFVKLNGMRIEKVNESHGAIRRLRELKPRPALRGAAFYLAVQVERPEKPSKTVLSLENGLPLLVERKLGRGKTFFFASAFAPRWNDLPLRVAFVPFLHCLIRNEAARSAFPGTLRCGQTLTLPAVLSDAVLSGPQGELAGRTEGSTVSFGPVNSPGIYHLMRGKQVLRSLAVNIPFPESELSSLPRKSIKDLLSAQAVLSVSEPGTAVKQAQELNPATELRNLFLIAFLVFVCSEGILGGIWAFRR